MAFVRTILKENRRKKQPLVSAIENCKNIG
jgi:hypothetical protein